MARRDGGECGHRLVRQQRQDDAGQDQEFAGGDDLVDIDAPRELVKFLAPGEQKNRDDRETHRKPGRQRQCDRAQKISVNIERRHHQPDIRLAFVVAFADMLTIENGEPNAEHDQPGGDWEEMGRVEEVKHAAGGGEDRKGADAARAPDVTVGEEVLKSKAEKEAQPDQKCCARQ